MKASFVFASALAIAVGIAGTVHLVDRSTRSAAAAVPAAPVAPLRLRFAAGERATYQLRWASAEQVRLSGLTPGDAPVGGEARLDADLVLEGRGEIEGAFVVSARCGAVREARLSVLGGDLVGPSSAAPLAGVEALVVVEPSGHVREIRVASEVSAPQRLLFASILRDLELTLPERPADRWRAIERGARGVARVSYTRDGSRVRRVRESYDELAALPGPLMNGAEQRLRAAGTASLGESGALEALDDEETLEVSLPRGAGGLRSSRSLALRRTGTERVPPSVLDRSAIEHVAIVEPGGGADAEAAEREQLARVADGATVASVVARVADHGAGRRISGDWMVRAVAVLQLHPEAAGELARAFADPKIGAAGRRLVTDLLASAGHAPAQAALRRVLEAGGLDAREHVELVQRLGMVARPDRDTVDWLSARYERARDAGSRDEALAAGYALGAATARAVANGSGVEAAVAARAGLDRLRADLAATDSPADRAALLTALGNAALDDDLERLVAACSDESADVRRAATLALGRYGSPAARAAVSARAADPDPDVRSAAERALGASEPSDAR